MRLLRAELIDGTDLDDAEHWCAVYAELLDALMPIAKIHPSPVVQARVVELNAGLRFGHQRAVALANTEAIEAIQGSS